MPCNRWISACVVTSSLSFCSLLVRLESSDRMGSEEEKVPGRAYDHGDNPGDDVQLLSAKLHGHSPSVVVVGAVSGAATGDIGGGDKEGTQVYLDSGT